LESGVLEGTGSAAALEARGLERTRVTYRAERVRALFAGALEPAFGTFLLLIAVREFGASPAAKSWLVAGPSLGMMLGPVVVTAVEALRVRASVAMAWITAGAACLIAAGAAAEGQWSYVIPVALGAMGVHCTVPLMTQVYRSNYPAASLGRYFSGAFVLRIAAAAAASQFVGWWLTREPEHTSGAVLGFGSAALCGALCWLRVPSDPLSVNLTSKYPWRGLRFVREDAVFRRTLMAWMLMGVGNLVMLPLRVEYLARPMETGMRTAAEIALLTAVVPNVARLLTTQLWGRAFDRLNFFRLRAVLNMGFALAILAFFTGDSMPWMVAGAVLYGVSTAGGDVAWSLWVTKMAPPERVADYMGVHTFLTGVRGVVAPLLAFHAAERLSIEGIGWVCAALVFVANLILLPELRLRRN
jgi:MFS family permease